MYREDSDPGSLNALTMVKSKIVNCNELIVVPGIGLNI